MAIHKFATKSESTRRPLPGSHFNLLNHQRKWSWKPGDDKHCMTSKIGFAQTSDMSIVPTNSNRTLNSMVASRGKNQDFDFWQEGSYGHHTEHRSEGSQTSYHGLEHPYSLRPGHPVGATSRIRGAGGVTSEAPASMWSAQSTPNSELLYLDAQGQQYVPNSGVRYHYTPLGVTHITSFENTHATTGGNIDNQSTQLFPQEDLNHTSETSSSTVASSKESSFSQNSQHRRSTTSPNKRQPFFTVRLEDDRIARVSQHSDQHPAVGSSCSFDEYMILEDPDVEFGFIEARTEAGQLPESAPDVCQQERVEAKSKDRSHLQGLSERIKDINDYLSAPIGS